MRLMMMIEIDDWSESGGQSLNLKSSESTLPNHYIMSEDKSHTV